MAHFRCFAAAVWMASTVPAMAQSPPPKACTNPEALGTSRVLEVGTQGGLEIGLKTYPHTLALADHEVVLTFDDGPFPATTGPILDALAHECVQATFFLIGRNAQANPAFVMREKREGHTIGHHTFSHPDVTLRGWLDARAKADIDHGFAADDAAAGYGLKDMHPQVGFFRFPGFADTPELRRYLASRNIAIFGADLWASDWNPMSADTQLAVMMKRLEAQGRGIILLHDTKPQTAEMLPVFLRKLKAGGYHVVALKPADGPPPALEDAPPGWQSETEATLKKMMPRLLAADAKLRALATAKPTAQKPAALSLRGTPVDDLPAGEGR